MNESSQKKPPGRQKGWRKAITMNSRIPAMRIPDHLEAWLQVEADKRGLAISDMARMFLLEMKASKTSSKEEVEAGN